MFSKASFFICHRATTAFILLFFIICTLLSSHSQAHDARPLSVTMVEQVENIYRVVVRAPPTQELTGVPLVIWPSSCEVRESIPLREGLGSTSLIACSAGLRTQTLKIQYPDFNPSLTTLLRLESIDGSSTTAVLPPDELSWTIPAEANWRTVAVEYSLLGFQHIWAGIDHLLFVVGLLILARGPRKILLAVTGFTLGHSLTLSLAALELIRVPVSLVEAMIALSILFLAAEIARDNPRSFSIRFPIVLSFVFGLLHGFGFASALGEISLPTNEVVTGLLLFNVGVELGQLSFILLVLFVVLISTTKGRNYIATIFTASIAGQPLATEKILTPTVITLCAYLLGIPAGFWFVERTILAFTGT